MRCLRIPLYLFAILLGWAVTSTAPAQSSTNTVNPTYIYANFSLQASNLATISLTPLAAAGDYFGTILYSNTVTFAVTNTNSFTFTNVVSGYAYRITFADIYGYSSQITNFFPVTDSGPISGQLRQTQSLGFDALGRVISAAYVYPFQSGTWTLTNLFATNIYGSFYDFGGTNQVGSLNLTNWSAIPPTNVPLLNVNNTWNLTATNFMGTVAANANANGTQPAFLAVAGTTNGPPFGTFPILQMNFAGSPLVLMTLSPYHDGNAANAQNCEIGWFANSHAFLGTQQSDFQTWVQVGGSGANGPSSIDLQYLGANIGIPFRAGSFINWMYGIYYNGGQVPMTMGVAVSSANSATGLGTWSVYDAYPLGTNGEANNSLPAASSTQRFDVISGVGIKGYGATLLDYTSATPSTTNYGANIGQSAQDVYMIGPLNISVTNLTIITNTLPGTKNELASKLFIYNGLGSNSLTFSNNPSFNWIWVNETGTAVAPTNIAGSKVMKMDLDYVVTGFVTNCFASFKLGPYVPFVDADAVKFFAAVNNNGGNLSIVESNAVNVYAITAKADGTWNSNSLIYPCVGGTTNSMSWPLKYPAGASSNLYRLAFHGTIVTNALGFAGDGTTGYADTGFKPDTSDTTNYSQLEASVAIYLHAGGANATGAARFYGAQDGSSQTILTSNSVTSVLSRLNSTSDGGLGSLTGLNGLFMNVVHAGTGYLQGPGNSISGAATTVTPPNQNMFLGARNSFGSPDTFSTATISFFAIGGGLSPAQQAAEQADVATFEQSLGR